MSMWLRELLWICSLFIVFCLSQSLFYLQLVDILLLSMSKQEEKRLKNVFGEEDDDTSSDDLNQLHINEKYKDE